MSDEIENFYAYRGQWLDYLVTRRDFTHGDFRVAYFIASKISPGNRNMWWNVATIADGMNVSIATVTGATRRLSDAGLLVITKGAKGSYRYSIRMPFDPQRDAYEATPRKRKKTGGRKPRVSKNEIR